MLVGGSSLLLVLGLLCESRWQEKAVHFLHVGEGDATVFVTENRDIILVDTGRGGPYHADAGERIILPWLRKHGFRSLALLILSHEDMDHVGGAESILNSMPVRRLWIPHMEHEGRTLEHLVEVAHSQDVPVERVDSGRAIWRSEGISVQVLHPPTEKWNSTEDNENSVVVRVDFERMSVLMTGDVEARGEAWLVEHAPAKLLTNPVLKVAHHGGRRSSSIPFLTHVRPQEAVIPVGWKNPYHHPSIEVLERLQQMSARVWRGDECGEIILRPIFPKGYEMHSVRGCENQL